MNTQKNPEQPEDAALPPEADLLNDEIVAAVAVNRTKPVRPSRDLRPAIRRRRDGQRRFRPMMALAVSGWAVAGLALIFAWQRGVQPTPRETVEPVLASSEAGVARLQRAGLVQDLDALKQRWAKMPLVAEGREPVTFLMRAAGGGDFAPGFVSAAAPTLSATAVVSGGIPERLTPIGGLVAGVGEIHAPDSPVALASGFAVAEPGVMAGAVEVSRQADAVGVVSEGILMPENAAPIAHANVMVDGVATLVSYDPAADKGSLSFGRALVARPGYVYRLYVSVEGGSEPILLGAVPPAESAGEGAVTFVLGAKGRVAQRFVLALEKEADHGGLREENVVLTS